MDISNLTKTQVYEINFVYNKFRTIEAYENKENGKIYFYPNNQFLFIANKDDANTLFPYSKRNYGVFYLHKPSNNMYCSETYYTANKKLIQVIRSIKLQLDLKPLIDALFVEVNPVPVKTAMNLLGMDVGNLRLPLGHMQGNNIELLKKELKNAGLELK